MVIVIEKKVSIGKDVEDLPIIEIKKENENGKRTKICVGLNGGRITQGIVRRFFSLLSF